MPVFWVFFWIAAALFVLGPLVLKALKGKPQPLPPPDWLSKVDTADFQKIKAEFETAISGWSPQKILAANDTLTALLANDLQRCAQLTQILSLEEFNVVKGAFDKVFLAAVKSGAITLP